MKNNLTYGYLMQTSISQDERYALKHAFNSVSFNTAMEVIDSYEIRMVFYSLLKRYLIIVFAERSLPVEILFSANDGITRQITSDSFFRSIDLIHSHIYHNTYYL